MIPPDDLAHWLAAVLSMCALNLHVRPASGKGAHGNKGAHEWVFGLPTHSSVNIGSAPLRYA